MNNPRVVKEDVQATKLSNSAFDCLLTVAGHGYIDREKNRSSPTCTQFLDHLLSARLVLARDCHSSSLLREEQGRRAPDPGGTAGNQRDFPLQSPVGGYLIVLHCSRSFSLLQG